MNIANFGLGLCYYFDFGYVKGKRGTRLPNKAAVARP